MKSIIKDTLKKKTDDGTLRWSRTSLTMLSAWIVVLSMAIVDYCKHGIRYDVWATLVCVALGSKLTDAISQKLNK